MASSNNQISKSLSSIRGIVKESKELSKNAEILGKKITKGEVIPDGTTVVKLSSKHGSLIKHKKTNSCRNFTFRT